MTYIFNNTFFQKKRNNWAVLIVLCISLLGTASCGLLDQESPNDIDADTAIVDAASAEAALVGVYNAMQRSTYYGGNYMVATEAVSDNGATGGYVFLSLDQFGAKAITPENLIVEEMWVAMYRVVANANRLLEALPNVKNLSAGRKGEIEGEARVLRALVHFDVLRYYGEHWNMASKFGIPNIARTQGIADVSTRGTVSDTYKFIESDLNAAEKLLSKEHRAQYVGINTLNALSARICLYRKEYQAAIGFATKVVENTTFKLLPSAEYATIYTGRRTPESIFELSFDSQNRSAFNGLTYARDAALRPEIYYMASQSLGDFFKNRKDDIRATMVNFDASKNDPTVSPDGRSDKYRGESSQDNPAYILRLAEQYLILAEAKGRTNGLADLNTLRTTRGMTALTAADVNTDEKFKEAVLDERRAELNFEGHRLFDLARTGSIKKVLDVDDFRGIFPIPTREMNASNGAYTQNPGY